MAGLVVDASEDGLAPLIDELERTCAVLELGEGALRPVELGREVVEIVEIAQILAQFLKLDRPDLEQLGPQRRQKLDMMQVVNDGFARFVQERHLLAVEPV